MGGKYVMYHFQVKRSKVKVTWVVSSFGPVCSVAWSLCYLITSYVGCIQHMRGRCVAHHFQVKRSKVRVTWVVSSFGPVCSMAWSLCYLITSYVAHIQRMRSRCVAHDFQCQRSRSHRSCEAFPLSAPWLAPYCLVKWVKYLNVWCLRYVAAIRSIDLLVKASKYHPYFMTRFKPYIDNDFIQILQM